MARRRSRKRLTAKAVAIIAIILIIALVALWLLKTYRPDIYNKIFGIETYEIAAEETLDFGLAASGDLEIHFLELGNTYPGDCVYVKAGDKDILIDAGSETSSIPTIKGYLDAHVTDNTLEYVIVTHAHEDHYAGFATAEDTDSLFDLYVCEVIITFSMTNQKDTSRMYSNFMRELNDEIEAGATHYTAAECIEQNIESFVLSDGITLEILDSYYYYNEADSENDYSVCCMLRQGERNFLFTGDLEASGEHYLTEMNDLPQVVLFKAGHHGSKTSSTDTLLAEIQPMVCVVTCVAGADPHGANPENRFPSQAFVDRIAKYTSRVYVTTISTNWEEKAFGSMNGCIILESRADSLKLKFTKDNVRLKDSEWFAANREMPKEWE